MESYLSQLLGCRACLLCQGRTQVVPGDFPERLSLLFVGEAPGENEDRSGRPFVGRAGQTLDWFLNEVGIDREKVGIVNIVRCRPPGNRDPLPEEAEACSKWLLADILRTRPRMIVALGRYATAFFCRLAPTEVKITQIRGQLHTWTHPQDPSLTIDVIPTLHPAYVAREMNIEGSPVPFLFQSDLCAALSLTVADAASIPSNTGLRKRNRFMPGTKFVAGWHVGSAVYLVFRDAEGNRQVHVEPTRWYFLIREEDLNPKARAVLGRALVKGVPTRRGKAPYRILKMERDEIDGWIRVYPDVPNHWVSKEVKRWLPEEEAKRYSTVSPFLDLAQFFQALSVRTFEADVDPLRRFLTDNVVELESENLRVAWFDIETDDEAMAGKPLKDVIGNVPILSIAVETVDGKTAFAKLEGETLSHERQLLEWFFHCVVPHVDVLVAWNGVDFDFPFLMARARVHRISVAPQATIWWDGLLSFKKHHRWGGGEIQSYALDNVGQAILGERKHSRTTSIKELWRSRPDELETYNCRDAHLTRRIEDETGYVAADLMQNAVSNNFACNTYVGLRIDGLVLVEGYTRGTHFRTKFIGAEGETEQYVGAYVLPPVLGAHEEIANFDFASLYPSIFTTFNISPDTWVPANEAPTHAPEDLTTCPKFEVDGVVRGGERFLKSPLGIIPTIYVGVAERRAYYKREMKKAVPLSPEWRKLKRLEYVWKTLGLSMYGVLGSIYSRVYNRAVAQSITLSAQFMMRCTLELARRLGYEPIYGDTDSVFIRVKDETKDVPEFLSGAQRLYAQLVGRFNCKEARIELEHEQTFEKLFIFAKKRYFGRLKTQKGQPVPKDAPPEIKGLEVQRSDGVKYARVMQQEFIDGVLSGWTETDAHSFVVRHRDLVLNHGISPEQLQATAGLTKDPKAYKSRGPHVRIAEQMQAAGEEIYVGQKIAWIIVDASVSPMVVVPVADYKGQYDAIHYWNEKIYEPVLRLLVILWPSVNWAAMKVKRPRKPRKSTA